MVRYDCSGRMRRTPIVLGLSILVLCLGLLPGCQTVASFNVNTVSDLHDAQLGDGLCDTNLTQGGSQCSLRAAIEEANAFDPGSRIAVNFIVSGTFELSLPSGRAGAGNSLFVAGGRFQKYDQLAGKGRPFTANTDTNGQTWVPRAGLVYRYTDELSFYGSYTESFKPNSTIAPLTGGVVLDSAIAPEQAKSWEVGAKLDMPGRITGTLALYDIKKRNVLVSTTVGDDTVYSAAGEVSSRGLELDVSGQLSEQWSLIGSYAYTDAQVTKDPIYKGMRLQNVAKNSGSLSAVYDFGTVVGGDKLRVGAGARYVGERAGDALNDFDLPGYTVADAFATYDTRVEGQKVTLQLNLKNLFDRTYYTSAASRTFVSMGDSRQVSVASTLEF